MFASETHVFYVGCNKEIMGRQAGLQSGSAIEKIINEYVAQCPEGKLFHFGANAKKDWLDMPDLEALASEAGVFLRAVLAEAPTGILNHVATKAVVAEKMIACRYAEPAEAKESAETWSAES